jgi:hypothetical protein
MDEIRFLLDHRRNQGWLEPSVGGFQKNGRDLGFRQGIAIQKATAALLSGPSGDFGGSGGKLKNDRGALPELPQARCAVCR